MDDLYMDFFSLEDFDGLWDLGDFSTESEAADSESNPTGQKRRWVETVHHMRSHRPRILKADFRRTFPQMWASVFNSADYATMVDHLDRFYDKDVTILQQDLRLGAITKGVKTKGPLTGQSNLGDFWYCAMKVAPDQVCTLKHTYVKLRSDGTSSVTCTFGLTGTEIIAVESNPREQASEVHKINASAFPADLVGIKQEISDEDPLQEVFQRYIKAAETVNRTKAQIKAAKAAKARARYAAIEGMGRKRRKVFDSSEPLPNVNEWLAGLNNDHCANNVAPEAASVSEELLACRACYPSVVDAVRNFPTHGFTLRDENNHFIPNSREYVFVHGKRGGLLTSQLNLTCSVELRFNASCRVESVVVTYLD